MSSSGKKDTVVIKRGARAGFEALEQIVYLHMKLELVDGFEPPTC